MFKLAFFILAIGVLLSHAQQFPYNNGPQFNRPFPTPYIPIIDYSNEINIDGSYRYNFATADGKVAEESGYLKDVTINNEGEPIGIQVVQGSYSYTAPDGTPVQVSYIADENGFQPTSIRIPSDERIAGNPLIPRQNLFPSQLRNPYNVGNPYFGRYDSPYFNNYNKPIGHPRN